MIEKIPFANNLIDLFAKTLTRRVFDGHKDNIGVRFVPSMLWGLVGEYYNKGLKAWHDVIIMWNFIIYLIEF